MSVAKGEAGVDCTNCGYREVVKTQQEVEKLEERFIWRCGNPVCPGCGESTVFRHLIVL